MSNLLKRLLRDRRDRLEGFRDDRRGTSMVTSALLLPLLIVLFLGTFWVLALLFAKWQLSEGTREAAQHLSEMGRIWVISGTQIYDPSGTGNSSESYDPLPAEFFEWEAKRVAAMRMRTIFPTDEITARLMVTVTEPALSYGPNSNEVVDEGFIDNPCPKERRSVREGDYLAPENVRLLVRTSYEIPWLVRMPWDGDRYITIHDRAVGFMQCPRWVGQQDADIYDKSILYNVQGPHLPRRETFPFPVYPTITPVPPTITPTPSLPTVTPSTP